MFQVFTYDDDDKAKSVSLMLVGIALGIACAAAIFKMIIANDILNKKMCIVHN
jgi:hypothetical protein